MFMMKQPHPPARDEARWEAVVRRDKAADDTFFYSVATTGVYCRPSCAARLPLRRNVAFHDSPEAAARAGFRPCKRCRPDERDRHARHADAVAAACRRIEQALDMGDAPPDLAALAAGAGLSPFHFHRVFKDAAGVTPRAYAASVRAARVKAGLGAAASVTEAIYDAGYGSNGRFYEASSGVLGMRPRAWRDGGRGEEIRFAVGDCSLGAILVAATGAGVCAIELGDDPQALLAALQDRFPRATLLGADAAFEALVARVVGLVERPGQGSDLPLDVRGTAFQQRVWQALRDIPAGRTASYTEVALTLGMPRGARAVAAACAANHAAVAIPCHRVVRTDGDLAGYRWGVERKRALLEREGAR